MGNFTRSLTVSLCAECAAALEPERARVNTSLAAAAQELADTYYPQMRFSHGFGDRVVIQGPDELVAHGGIAVGPYARTDRGSARRLTASRKHELLMDSVIAPLISDVAMQQWHNRHYGLNYLTHRPIERGVISRLNGGEAQTHATALLKGLKHSVPVLDTLDPSTLIALRKEEGEAFEAYRIAVAKVLRTADLTSSRRIKEAFEDAVAPELARIRASAANARKLAKSNLQRDVGVGAAFITVGLFLGFVQPTLAAIVAGLSGIKAAARIVDGVRGSLAAEPPIVRESSFYFLWRVQQAAAAPKARLAVRP